MRQAEDFELFILPNTLPPHLQYLGIYINDPSSAPPVIIAVISHQISNYLPHLILSDITPRQP